MQPEIIEFQDYGKQKIFIRILRTGLSSYNHTKGIFINCLGQSGVNKKEEEFLFNLSPKSAEFLIKTLKKELKKSKNEENKYKKMS